MLLSVPTGVVHGDIDGPGPRHRICRLQVGVVRFLLKDVDRSLGICSEGRRQAVEGAADGDERSPREIDDPQIEQIHSDGGHVRRSVHRRLLDHGRLHSGDRAQHRDLARRHHHLSLFRNLRQFVVFASNSCKLYKVAPARLFLGAKHTVYRNQERKLNINQFMNCDVFEEDNFHTLDAPWFAGFISID